MKKIILCLSIILAGCAVNSETIVETKTERVEVSAVVDEVASIISEENEYRLASGSAPYVLGLVCTLHNVSSTTPSTIPANPPAAVATFVYNGSFNQPDASTSSGMNVLPSALRSSYTQWYVLKCQGQIVIVDSEYKTFYLSSDDASKLYIDGTVLVDNDGNHGFQMRSGVRLLKRGVHTFRLDYMQGPGGNHGLVLEDSTGIVSSSRFYR